MKKYKWLFVDIFVISIILVLAILLVVFGKLEWKWASIFFIASYIFNLIFVFFSVVNSDNQNEKMSWIFFMMFVPIVGLVFYSLFRVRREKGISIEEYEKKFEEFQINKYDQNKNNNLIAVCEWQSKLSKKNFYKTNLEIYQNGYEAYEKLLSDIENARKYIHIEMYIVKISEIYEKLKKLLFKKVNEGVEVKMIIDKFGSWKVPIDEFKHLEANGIDLCFFNVPIYPYVRHTDNKRLHRKFFIIDGQVVHFGGLNISDEYCSYSTKYGYWADSNFIANGKIINEYESIFLFDWFNIKKEKLDVTKYINNSNIMNSNTFMLSFDDGPTKKTNHLEDSIDYWVNNSLKSIKLVTPYFIPSEKIFNTFKNALRRGVELQIYIPGKPDKKFTYKGTLFYVNELAKYGAKIFIFNETFVHSKFAIFDDKLAYIGTNNLDMRSFYSNQESINLLFGDESINKLKNIFEDYKIFSNLHNYKKSKVKYIKQFIFKLTSPLM